MKTAAVLVLLVALAHANSITACQLAGRSYYCVNTDGEEGVVSPAPTGTAPESYTSCHRHGVYTYCMYGDDEVLFSVAATRTTSVPTITAATTTPTSTTPPTAAQLATTSPALSLVLSLVLSLLSLEPAMITGCHSHGSAVYCLDAQGNEGLISPAPSGTVPASYTSCHAHGTKTYCVGEHDEEVYFSYEATTSAASSASAQTTAVTDCHAHGSTLFCVDGSGNEGYITPAPSNLSLAPASYTSCAAEASATTCVDAAGAAVQFVVETETTETTATTESTGLDCHYHAGVEHCVGAALAELCERVDRDYNIPLRIGLLFAILGGSLVGAFAPLVAERFLKTSMDGIVVVFLRQFGTGVVLSTALVHLMTHAQLMFANSCITLRYESTASAIAMAGLALGFVAEYTTKRVLQARQAAVGKATSDDENSTDTAVAPSGDAVSVMLLEAGIVFHSVLLGVTLVVAGDSSFITLFIVILFHQAFEGLALGSRIAALAVAFWQKALMAVGFAVTTPVGMAIGIGVLGHFNGNDKATIIALGTLDAFSAGILLWVGLFEMLAHDWIYGSLVSAGAVKVAAGAVGLVGGMVLMSVLGKWA